MSEKCRVCDEPTRALFRSQVLSYEVDYYECLRCGFVQTETPYWLSEAYSSAINLTDTGIMRRNQRNTALVIRILSMVSKLRGRVIDLAGGYGLLVRMLRDAGVDAYWNDPYCNNLVARGFEVGVQEGGDLVTAFEVLEHLEHPLPFFESAFQRSDHLLVSTQIIPSPAPSAGSWWYYGAEHGQHVAFYRPQTLEFIAKKFGWHVSSNGKNFHFFTRRPVTAWRWRFAMSTKSLSPWIAKARLRSLTWPDHHALSVRKAA